MNTTVLLRLKGYPSSVTQLTQALDMQNDLWRFFFEYWDDNIIAPQSERVFVNARTVRVLEVIHGKSVVRKHLDFWVNEESIRVLGEADLLDPESRCVELIGYVSELPASDAPQDGSPSR